jgi:undecaprenyl-diphosphatase
MTALLLLLGRHDERFLYALVARRRQPLDRVMSMVTHLGDTGVVVGAVLLLSLAPAGWGAVGHETAFVLAVSHLWVQMVKRTISRPRPRLPVGYESLIAAPDRFSFPSGHAAASLSLALPVAGALPASIGAAIVGLAAVVGVSRCYLGVHYPGDVVMGWSLALLGWWIADPAILLLTS